MDLKVDADALVEEEKLVGSRDQDGVVGFKETNTQNDGILKITNDDAGDFEGDAGSKVELNNGGALRFHELLRGRHDPGLVTFIKKLGLA